MTYVTGRRYYDVAAYSAGLPRKAVPQNILGAAALAFIGLACAWTLYTNVSGGSAEFVTASLPPLASRPSAEPVHRIAAAYDALEEILAPRAVQATTGARAAKARVAKARIQDPEARARTALLYGPRFLGPPPGTFEPDQVAPTVASVPVETAPEALPLPPAPQIAAIVPVPAPRPAELRQLQAASSSRRDVAQASAAAAPEPKKPSIFEKLFGRPAAGLQLAFAAPDGGVRSDGQSLTLGRIPQYDQFTAVYDISARRVYLPDGSTLEAHSGLGKMMDDPRSADRKMRGVTPPHVYDLSLRERPFHGVEAIRLKPIGGEDKIHGRTGLLAHTYMLGPSGASNGCVSFKNYDAFLRAYKSGKINRLAVVAKL